MIAKFSTLGAGRVGAPARIG